MYDPMGRTYEDMAALKYKVELNESERTHLKQMASRGETSARKVKRALVDRRQLFLPVLLPHRRMLPNFRRFSIDAHRSDITQSHLIDLPVFG